METNSSQTWFTSKKGWLPLPSFDGEMKWKKHKRTKVFARALKRELIHSDIFAGWMFAGSSSALKKYSLSKPSTSRQIIASPTSIWNISNFWKTHKAIYTEFVTSKNAKRNREADWNFWGWWRSLKNDVSWLGIRFRVCGGKYWLICKACRQA